MAGLGRGHYGRMELVTRGTGRYWYQSVCEECPWKGTVRDRRETAALEWYDHHAATIVLSSDLVPAYVELQSTYEKPPGPKGSRVPGTRKARRVRPVPDVVDPASVPAGYRLADGSFQPSLIEEAA